MSGADKDARCALHEALPPNSEALAARDRLCAQIAKLDEVHGFRVRVLVRQPELGSSAKIHEDLLLQALGTAMFHMGEYGRRAYGTAPPNTPLRRCYLCEHETLDLFGYCSHCDGAP